MIKLRFNKAITGNKLIEKGFLCACSRYNGTALYNKLTKTIYSNGITRHQCSEYYAQNDCVLTIRVFDTVDGT